jgi:hypothetical protein
METKSPNISCVRNAFVCLIGLSCLMKVGFADEKAGPEANRAHAKNRMREMSSMADRVTIELTVHGKPHQAKRHPAPLLRTIEYGKTAGDEDGSLWIWSHNDRPVAMVELWALDKSHDWGHSMLAVANDTIQGSVGDKVWKPKPGQGVWFKTLLKTKKPDARVARRSIQIRQISKRFSAIPFRRMAGIPGDASRYQNSDSVQSLT